MYPLPTHTVDLVLQYIAPLTDALPPHLISVPLRQRHHFLQLSPASPLTYLCWPNPDSAAAIDLLDRLPRTSDHSSYPTRYTSDAESTFAHAQISSDAQGLRILFHWDDGWKYHDLRLMPFPSPSSLDPQELLTADSPSTAESGPPQPPSFSLFAEADSDGGGNDDSYWDAYGSAELDPTSTFASSSASMSGAAQGEDAYWAQYSSVQGSADSTIPSPMPINRKLRYTDSNPASRFLPKNDPIISVPMDAILSHPSPSKQGPPSPNTLADLLTTLSPRKDIFSPGLDVEDSLQSPLANGSDPSTAQTATDSEIVTPPLPNESLHAAIDSPVQVHVNHTLLPDCRSRSLDETEDKALTDSIKGLYHLWRVGRKGAPDEPDRNVFLRVVQAAIPYE